MRQIKNEPLVLLLLWLLPTALFAQEKIDFSRQKIGFFNETFSVPPSFAKRTKVTHAILVEEKQVIKRGYSVRKSVFVRTKLCSQVAGTEIPLNDPSLVFRVKSAWSYEFKKKTFAYELEYEFFDKDSGDEIGATTSMFYIDERGHGKFRATCVPNTGLKYVPNWIRRSKNK